jgi:regulatory Fis family protein
MSQQSVYHSLVAAFQVEVIRRALTATGGNRSHAARLLGLQRTYLLRLMRDRAIDVPRSVPKGRGSHRPAVAAATAPEFRIEITGWEPVAGPNGDDRSPMASLPPSPATGRDRAVLVGSSDGSRRSISCSPSNRSR